ncbi:MAG: hypothetical protein OEY49_07895 [Candidatus Heimdallarchaeota archaeon]|nr:hypothetical protein [Candidatus Heimdallarchaeota archaeon]
MSSGGINFISEEKQKFITKEIEDRVNAIFKIKDTFPDKTFQKLANITSKGWLTRQYFSRGKHDLVLPAWVLGILGPDGEAKHGIAGSIDLRNTDLRSYYALGSPTCDEEPVIDHRGGIIPIPESYTIMFGILINNRAFYSSERGVIRTEYHDEGYPIVTVYWELESDTLVYDVFSDRDEEGNELLAIQIVRGFANHSMLVTLCPMDQDSITTIPKISYDSKLNIVTPEDKPSIVISELPIRSLVLPISEGHAGRRVINANLSTSDVTCKAKMASWAAEFPVRANPTFTIILNGEFKQDFPDIDDIEYKWEEVMENIPEISTSNEEADYYYKASAIVLRLLADIDNSSITIGPSVQEEMWLPGLVFQIIALSKLGFSNDVVVPVLNDLHHLVDNNGVITPDHQWDAQGAIVLAIAINYFYTGDITWLGEQYSSVKRIAEWVVRQYKKDEDQGPKDPLLIGLLPMGVASWFNPLYWKNNYYYSHNFWALGVLDLTIQLSKELGRHGEVEKFEPEFHKYKQNVDDSMTSLLEETHYLPAGPYQRDNAEMIFNLHAIYPLKLYLPGYIPLTNTVNWIWDNYVHDGGVLIDQPWNAYGSYFSILLAQCHRHNGDRVKVKEVIDFMLKNTTNRSGWAEGISPLTRKGSVGDSPNGYTAAEWVNLIIDMYIEEYKEARPILLKGMPVEWLKSGVSAKSINIFKNGKLNISAKLNGSIFTIEWEFFNRDNVNPQLYLPYPVKTLPKGVTQDSTFIVSLNDSSGKVEIELLTD